tara:strand:- start:958 stop:1755 length:798 start_codon:yes stop_codon:yes gene_type:complete
MVPFLKWAGGKRWLFTPEFIDSLPEFDRYIEPFLGGGAGFFALEPERAILSDVNPELIALYEVVRDDPTQLQLEISKHQELHCSDYYYEVRSQIPETKVGRAGRTLYLNRSCWNGLYRLNQKGKFNVPQGSKNSIILATDDFEYGSRLLSSATIYNQDFEVSINIAGDGDLVFVDPPYTVKHNMNGFVKYNESIFRWEDQIRLKASLQEAFKRGATIFLTNADHSSIRELYSDFGELKTVGRNSVISGKNLGRGKTTEMLVVAHG